MSARDFIRANATPNDEALMTYESEQICAYADLENADFILQPKRYIHSGLDPSTPSMLLNSAQKLDSVENATGVFKGEKPGTHGRPSWPYSYQTRTGISYTGHYGVNSRRDNAKQE